MHSSKPKPTSVHRPEQAVVAQLLRELRQAAGLTQRDAVKRVGLTQPALSGMETMERGLDLLVVRDLVQAYGGDWVAFIQELERRLASKPQPASSLIRGSRPEID
ncbi:MAG TPA: helix-turn-helix transcriptional regulator [Luteibacter sp.]|jgi:transcriptional regulator with XRE-family HTH domain|uniref:helix-turn-helix domain-containing protein n=1 Tax=Luteibacter sp. TaxID=1886636 RepID=UPI002F3F7195